MFIASGRCFVGDATYEVVSCNDKLWSAKDHLLSFLDLLRGNTSYVATYGGIVHKKVAAIKDRSLSLALYLFIYALF